MLDITGDRYGSLVVVTEIEALTRNRLFACLCDCGELTVVQLGNIRSGHTVSCGCLKETCGESHWNWKNGKYTTEAERMRKSPKYSKWRIDVFERDYYTCQRCRDNKGGNLEAHHIASFKDNPKERLAVSNGITLCKHCHKEYHMENGYKNFSSESIKEFTQWM